MSDAPLDQKPRSAPFDTFEGWGTGSYNNEAGATIHFEFVDAGEPGTDDTAFIEITDVNGNTVLEVEGNLEHGNQQAHPNNK